MKILIKTLFFLSALVRPAGDFYDLSFTASNGSVISLRSFTGKKVIIFPINGRHPDLQTLRILDSVAVKNQDSIVVLGFPALDFDSTATTQMVGKMHDSLGLHLTFGQPVWAGKTSLRGQNPIFQWLTSMDQNHHFNRDVEEEGQLFVVSKRGMLYSVINKDLAPALLKRVIATNVKE